MIHGDASSSALEACGLEAVSQGLFSAVYSAPRALVSKVWCQAHFGDKSL